MPKTHYKKIIIFCLCLILIVFGYYIYNKKISDFLPEAFVVHLEQDATSSGGSRYTSATIFFKGNILISGTLTYTHSRETTTKTTCTYKNGNWINQDGSLCTINFIDIPKTKKDFQNLMRDEKIKPIGDLCRHYDVCYSIEK